MADEDKAQEEEAPKKKSKLPIIIGIVVLNLVSVGGVGAYFIFFQAPAPAAAEAPPVEPLATEFGPLVELTPIIANLNDEHVGRYIRVTIHLEATNEETKLDVEEAIVPIRNRLVIYFAELTSEETMGLGSRERIRGELVEAINEVLGEPKVRRVFYTEFVVQ